jgi:hypothetical protein
MAQDQAQHSLLTAASLAGQQAATLLRLDVQLLELEMKEKALILALSGAWGLGAIVLLVMGTLVCVLGLVVALIAFGMVPFAAAFIVGIALCAIGGLSAWKARSMLQGWSLTPTRAVAQLRRDAEAVREGLRNGIG